MRIWSHKNKQYILIRNQTIYKNIKYIYVYFCEINMFLHYLGKKGQVSSSFKDVLSNWERKKQSLWCLFSSDKTLFSHDFITFFSRLKCNFFTFDVSDIEVYFIVNMYLSVFFLLLSTQLPLLKKMSLNQSISYSWWQFRTKEYK